MCGITGIYNIDEKKVDFELLKKITNVLKHRGPDGEGYYIKDNIGLGHRRLIIIDSSDSANQPMSNEDNSIWITYNGEIYNYIELREELKSKGHIFKSRSDTEVIIHSYEEYGFKCLEKFIGMFAFCIWDEKQKILFCAKDRFGIKPFYYYYNKDCFIFASEKKAILEIDKFLKEPDENSISEYLIYGFKNHKNNTFIKDIKSILPSHYIILEKSTIKEIKYWTLDLKEISERDNNLNKKFFDIFESSIKIHLRSDVPVGSCLSGGLDSSSIVCMINKIDKDQKIYAFSSVFKEEGINEKSYIDKVARQINVKIEYVNPSIKEFKNEIDKIIYYQEEPFSSTSIFAQWCVMKIARDNGIKVILDGQGGDEILAGYHYYFYSLFLDLIKNHKFYKFFQELVYYWDLHKYKKLDTLVHLLYYSLPSFLRDNIEFNIKRICFTNLIDKTNEDKLEENVKFNNILKKDLYSNLFNKLQALLHYEDRNSMAHSIEARVPFLDHRLVEFCFSLPNHLLLNNGMTKIILRESLKNILPDEITKRKDKIGFATPELNWFKTSLKDFILEILNSKSFKERGYFNVKKLIKEYELILKGKKYSTATLWRAINLELWFRKFFK